METKQIEDKTKIFASLFENVIGLADMVPAQNLASDPKLNQLAAEVKKALGSIKPEDLRKSAEAKKVVLEAAQQLVVNYTPYARKLTLE